MMNFAKNVIQELSNTPIYWKILALYLLLTGGIAIGFVPEIIVFNRVIFLVFFCVFLCISRIFPKIKNLISLILAYAFLGFAYKETALIHPLFFDPIDPLLMQIDVFLFGFQPALEFSKLFSQPWFSELMFFGYFSYYLIPIVIILSLYKQSSDKINELGVVLIGSFVIYYILFIFVPAVGPQFYWTSGDNYITEQGVFGRIVKMIQAHGEAPTAAFPSSHVGISVILLCWLYANNKKLFFGILPFTIILVFSTIYIKAHYAIDVVAGLLSGLIIYSITNDYNKRSKNG